MTYCHPHAWWVRMIEERYAQAIVSYSFDLCAKCLEPPFDPLVAAIYLADIVDHAAALGAQRGNQQGHAGANVGAGQSLRLTIQLARAYHHRAMRVAQYNLCAHGDQPIYKEQPA